jgi:hypothetical protein
MDELVKFQIYSGNTIPVQYLQNLIADSVSNGKNQCESIPNTPGLAKTE